MTALVDRPTAPASEPAQRLRPPVTRRTLLLRLVLVGFLVATVWAWFFIDMSLTAMFGGLGDMARLLGRMTPPRFDDLDQAIDLAFETLWMAVMKLPVGP